MAVLAVVAVMAAAMGCGEGDANEVSVETGDLSKPEFIKRADAICKATRTRFTSQYTAFLQNNPPKPSKASQQALLNELVEKIFVPTFERDIEEIRALGAPEGDEQEVSGFLTALKTRLEEIREEPIELSKTVTPLAKPAKAAQAYGLKGCAESFG